MVVLYVLPNLLQFGQRTSVIRPEVQGFLKWTWTIGQIINILTAHCPIALTLNMPVLYRSSKVAMLWKSTSDQI